MPIVQLSDTLPTTELVPVVHDLYRDIHKAIRVELFSVTTEAARLDASTGIARAALASQVRDVVAFLVDHAEHEDGAIQPVLERELPILAAKVAEDHEALDARMGGLVEMAEDAARLDAEEPGFQVHRLHLALASFTSAYLEHQDVEERVIMPTLQQTVGVDAVVGIHQAILAGIPPEKMGAALALMLPAINIDDRLEMLGGMRDNAPAEVFDGVWSLANSVLDPGDLSDLAKRLGII
ncbi:MAG: hemerythrin domain-containing protein [Acidimicrobiales bacterium]